MKQIKEVMRTPPISCKKDETVQSVAKQMFRSNIGFMPVVDDNQKVIGTITDRDVTMAIGRSNKSSDDLKVHEVMNYNPHTIQPHETASKALEIMRTRQVGRLPVVDDEKKLKGVISLMGLSRKITDSQEKSEIEHQGKENILNTFRILALRNSAETIDTLVEE